MSVGDDLKLVLGSMVVDVPVELLRGARIALRTNQTAHFHALTSGLPAAREGGTSRGGSWAVGVGW